MFSRALESFAGYVLQVVGRVIYYFLFFLFCLIVLVVCILDVSNWLDIVLLQRSGEIDIALILLSADEIAGIV